MKRYALCALVLCAVMSSVKIAGADAEYLAYPTSPDGTEYDLTELCGGWGNRSCHVSLIKPACSVTLSVSWWTTDGEVSFEVFDGPDCTLPHCESYPLRAFLDARISFPETNEDYLFAALTGWGHAVAVPASPVTAVDVYVCVEMLGPLPPSSPYGYRIVQVWPPTAEVNFAVLNVTLVPEPTSLLALGSCMVALHMAIRRRRA